MRAQQLRENAARQQARFQDIADTQRSQTQPAAQPVRRLSTSQPAMQEALTASGNATLDAVRRAQQRGASSARFVTFKTRLVAFSRL